MTEKNLEEGRAAPSQVSLPPNAQPVGDSPEFNEQTVPEALLQRHNTAEGRWAVLEVLEGELTFVDLQAGSSRPARPDCPVVVAPEMPHRVEVDGAVRFRLRFYRQPD